MVFNYFFRIFLLNIASLSYLTAWSQSTSPHELPGYDIRHFTDENGLPQNSIKSIVQDKNGNIWMATERGLCRYDGRRFRIFDDFGSSFAARNINGFHRHPDNKTHDLLALTHDGKWIRISPDKAVVDNQLRGISLVEVAGKTSEPVSVIVESLPLLIQTSITRVPNRTVVRYPAPGNGYFSYNGSFVDYYANNKRQMRFAFEGGNFFRFFRIGTNLYYLDAYRGAFRFSPDSRIPKPEHIQIKGERSWPGSLKLSPEPEIYWNNSSNQVFLSYQNTLYELSVATDGDLRVSTLLEGFAFQSVHIKSVFFDRRTGRIFLGSLLEGLYIVEKQSFQSVMADQPVSHDVYYGQALASDNSIITPQGIRFSMDRRTKKVVSQRLNALAGQIDWDQYSVLIDREGKIWSKKAKELFCFDSTGSSIIGRFTLPGSVTALYQWEDHRIWIGTTTAGLYYLDPTRPDKQPMPFVMDHLPDISWIERQGNETLWIGSGQGLHKVHLPTRTVSHIKGLENIYVRSLHIPAGNNEIWITTYADGIFLLKNGKLTRFPLDKNRYLANAHCIIEDYNGFFWITTNKGLFQISRKDLLSYAQSPFPLYYHYYSRASGFNTNEFNGGCQPCAIRMRDGIVSLPSIKGLVWFRPEQIRPEQPGPNIFIDDILINGKRVSVSQGVISVSAGESELDIQVNTPYYGDPYNLNLSYRLFKNGKPVTNWKDLDTSMKLSIPLFGSGNYKLRVRKLSGFNARNYGYKDIDIQIRNRWYQTTGFYAFSGLIASILLVFLVRNRINRIQSRNNMLEMQIGERTKELKATLSKLETSQSELLQQIHLQSRLMASIAHDVRTPLNAAIVVTRQMKDLIRKQQNDRALVFNENIEDAMIRVKDTLESLLAYVKIQIYKRDVKKEYVDLHQLVEKSFSLYSDSIKVYPNTFINEIPENIKVLSSGQLLDVIVQNVVDNSNKYTDAGMIRAFVTTEDGGMKLVIADSGYGLPEKILDWLNDVESKASPTGNAGIGLLIIKELAPFAVEKFEVRLLDPGTAFILQFSDNYEVELAD
ncbi:ligand-binding sensor domain-containing protein [Dyadobacter sp. MSC1_007]|uniref:ligand-binding sensor domain-containing protein n=1 Tax=Dyadobacter sp. MSC1_007 TaxID=2909264 RepID=UPI00202E0BD9|nr:two-component regulator propeller domain-containing protein [Dyadobacter sp. MSC1_007]